MNTIACPSCGAPVAFRSAASVMAVCGYCNSTLIRDADSVRNIGRMSDVLEDFSPIQIGTSGVVDGRGFTVVGRIQLRYPAGFWNEWYVVDDAGDGGWLSDASGQYVFTRVVDPATLPMQVMPTFEQIRPGGPLDLGPAPDGSRLVYVAGDVRSAQCTGGQGELPFTVGAGYTARVADFHRGDEFLTLDYSDDTGAGDVPDHPHVVPIERDADGRTRLSPNAVQNLSTGPVVYRGHAVTLAGLNPQLLRDADAIEDAAGRVKGKVSNLECPSCGSSIAFSPGATTHLLCQTCHASLDVAGPVAEVLAAARRVDAVVPTLPLGSKCTIAGAEYAVIGFMRRAEVADEPGAWTEYLLYAPQKGFFWLVETDDGWQRADVLDTWPWYSGDQALLAGEAYARTSDYRAVVRYAAGAFNWRVEVGDVAQVIEFAHGPARLAAEATDTELTWSRSTPVTSEELARMFGKQVDASRLPAGPPSLSDPPAGGYRRVAKWLAILLLAVNAIPILFSPGRALPIVLFAVVGLYVPAWLMDLAAKKGAGG